MATATDPPSTTTATDPQSTVTATDPLSTTTATDSSSTTNATDHQSTAAFTDPQLTASDLQPTYKYNIVHRQHQSIGIYRANPQSIPTVADPPNQHINVDHQLIYLAIHIKNFNFNSLHI